jgi:hypothetical protein
VERQGTRFTCSPETGVGGGAHRFVCGKHIAENGDWFAASKVTKEKSGQISVVSRTERHAHELLPPVIQPVGPIQGPLTKNILEKK